MNRLGGESSLYLRQHQDNPVDWYPWGSEAFARARAEDRPLLLSVGYSSCHWCHVMAHECFQDEQLAALQNRLFISIKVDREERPDVDRVYMEALQAFTGSGGWPMTMFLLPDGRPFFGGTYFPRRDRQGLPGFGRVMVAVDELYRNRRDQAERAAAALSGARIEGEALASGASDSPGSSLLEAAARSLLGSFDHVHGGLGGAPKFPQAPLLEFLLARAGLEQDREAAGAVRDTLRHMAEGGLRDQLGGGFHRYSVDSAWSVPHFEKMLYDQAQLISLYLHMWQLEGLPEALATARSTADFLLSEMQLPEVGFAASLDADSPAGEGFGYTWAREELAELLGADRDEADQKLFRTDPAASVDGRLVLQAGSPWGEPALGGDRARVERDRELRARMLAARGQRPQPTRDDKLVVGWNALAISALAELGLATGEERYLAAALEAGELLRRECFDPVRGLLHLWPDGPPADLEDLATTGLASLWLHQVSGDAAWFDWAEDLAQRAEAGHSDPRSRLWFDSGAERDPLLLARPMGVEDGATRSGNSLMAELCVDLHGLTGDPTWAERAEAALRAAGRLMERAPAAAGGWLLSQQLLGSAPLELALVVAPGGGGHLPLLASARAHYLPQLVVAVGEGAPAGQPVAIGPPLVLGRSPLEGAPTAYVCRGFSCRSPTQVPAQMERELLASE